MKTPRDDVRGCGGPGKPVYELKNPVAMLEREEERKQQEEKTAEATEING